MRPKLIKLTVLVAAIVLPLLALELAARVYVYATSDEDKGVPDHQLNFFAVSAFPWDYDEALGYRYTPGAHVTRLRISKGKPVFWNPIRINPLGNTDMAVDDDAQADLKVLVFGDSYTANLAHSGTAWPDALERQLEERLGKSVNVLGFGRDAYGVVQMFDLAAYQVPRHAPDIVVFAVISDDFTRGRFWRRRATVQGEPRGFAMGRPGGVDVYHSVDARIVDPGITPKWCEAAIAHPDGDALLESLNDKFRTRRLEWSSRVNYFSPTTSFLANRLLRGDPLASFRRPSPIPRLKYSDYSTDAQTVDNIGRLNATNVPFYLFQICDPHEMRDNAFRMNDRKKALRHSLERMTGKTFADFVGDKALTTAPQREQWKRYYLLPHDSHPSGPGMEMFAQVVADWLLDHTINADGSLRR